jgi:pimeloyl-ACP methyl ester carboxylesterase
MLDGMLSSSFLFIVHAAIIDGQSLTPSSITHPFSHPPSPMPSHISHRTSHVAAPPGRLIDVGGFRLHLHCMGASAPVVVFDAALGASSISWTLVQPQVASFARACTYDRAGFGWSDAGPLPRTAATIADELHSLLLRAGEPPPFVLVGHSFGALVMRIFAARHPASAAGLVLVDPAHPEDWVDPSPDARASIERGRRLCKQGERAARLGVARAVAALVNIGALSPARVLARVVSRGGLQRNDESILAPMWKLPAEARRPLRFFWTQPKFFEALGSQIDAIGTSAAEVLRESTTFGDLPVTTISSTNPPAARRQRQDALAARSTRGTHIIASNSGHWIPLDQPEIVVDAIRAIVNV